MDSVQKLKARVRRLERCLEDLRSDVYIAARELAGCGLEYTEEYRRLRGMLRRANRTLPEDP